MWRHGVNLAAALLTVVVVAFVSFQGSPRTELESEGMKEYNLAQAKALLASDEVEVRNSKRRLSLIKRKLAGEEGKTDVDAAVQKDLSKLLMRKAQNYELQADLSEAKIAKIELHHKDSEKTPQVSKQEASIEEEDDKLYARALRHAAHRDSKTKDHLEHVHLYLQQYGSKTALKVGQKKEEEFLHDAKARMQVDRKNVKLLMKDQERHATPENKVDAEEQEAMAIENLEKQSEPSSSQ